MKRSIYLDHHASTPLDPRALEAMMPFLTTEMGNPSSLTHDWGIRARQAVDRARRQVADLIAARPTEIVFTSGATESNNLAIKGLVRNRRRFGGGDHIVTSSIEHKSVACTVSDLEQEGFRVTRVAPDAEGRIQAEAVAAAMTAETVLVSILAADGEIGSIQPATAIGALCRERGVVYHTDATQAVARLPLDVADLCCDLLSLSAHKFYGPKGVGALYVRDGVEIDPLVSGGGQERGLRSGTLNVPGIVGLGVAAEICVAHRETESARLRALGDRLLAGIRKHVPDARLHGPETDRLPGNLNLSLPYMPAQRLLMSLSDFALSTGSACQSGKGMSHVLEAIGVSPEEASCTVRIGLGRATSEEQVDRLVEALGKATRSLRPRVGVK